jgi:hypothetical protein
MNQTGEVPQRLQHKYAQLQQSLAASGYISDGSVLDRSQLKRPRSGYQWTRKVGQKTITVALSQQQYLRMKQAIANGRRLRKTIRQMELLSRQILFQTTPDTRRFKKLSLKDLG